MLTRSDFKIIAMFCCTAVSFFSGRKVHPAILMYHSIDVTTWKHGVSPTALEKQIIYLKKKRRIVSLKDIVKYSREEKVSNKAIAITIDDGYEDTYTVLYTLAKKYNFSFTLFLTTDLSVKPKLGNLSRPTWEQLKEMSDSGLVDIQAHGHSHINFPQALSEGILDMEIDTCRQLIHEKLRIKTTLIAYPAGMYSTKVLEYVSNQGYTAGFSTHMGVVQKNTNPLLFKRILVDRDTSMALFKLRIQSGLPLYLFFIHVLRRRYS